MRLRALIAAGVTCLAAPATTSAQHEHETAQPAEHDAMAREHDATAGPLGISMAREGSGTSWLPDGSPMHMLAHPAGSWSLGLMANVFLQYVHERGRRGDDQLGSVNWVMGMARRPLAQGQLRARAMLSLEPATVGRCGYPDLLATGELCRGDRLVDRQHPHDLFMELAAGWGRALGRRIAIDLYAAAAGEPALGPTAYPHRISAMASPIAPITHHWVDSAHISFGVVTAGVHSRRWKAEASAFNGREPDEHRWDLDLGALDSYSGRLWYLPGDRWAIQVSAGFLREAEQEPGGGPRVDVTRATASATYHRPVGERTLLATTAVWGRNDEEDHATSAFLLESSLDVGQRDVLFARVEAAEKTSGDLVLPGRDPEETHWVAKLALAYVRQLGIDLRADRSLLVGIGAGLSLDAVPAEAEAAYGTRWPVGFLVFANVRPGQMPRHR